LEKNEKKLLHKVFLHFFVPSLIRHTLNIYEETLKLIEKKHKHIVAILG